MFATLRKFSLHRMHVWLLVSVLLLLFIAAIAPQQLPVALYKLLLITSAAWVAYWIDCSLFPYARPDTFVPRPWSVGGPMHPGKPNVGALDEKVMRDGLLLAFALVMLRRALIISAAMIAVALGA